MCRKVALVHVEILRFVAHETAIQAYAWDHAHGIVACRVAIVGAFGYPNVAQGAVDKIASISHTQGFVKVVHGIAPAGAGTVAAGKGFHIQPLHVIGQCGKGAAQPTAGVASTANVAHPHLIFSIGQQSCQCGGAHSGATDDGAAGRCGCEGAGTCWAIFDLRRATDHPVYLGGGDIRLNGISGNWASRRVALARHVKDVAVAAHIERYIAKIDIAAVAVVVERTVGGREGEELVGTVNP